MVRKTSRFPIHDLIEIPVIKDRRPQSLVIRPKEINGVYLRLVQRSANTEADLFQICVSINGCSYEISYAMRGPAFQMAKDIADLSLLAGVGE
jgi:hypothetical protein